MPWSVLPVSGTLIMWPSGAEQQEEGVLFGKGGYG